MFKEINKTYSNVINNIKEDINKTQLDIMVNANISLVNLYYRIGKVLYDNSIWGNKFLDGLVFELKMTYSNQKGSQIYRTDQDGSIMFKIRNQKLSIETCIP